MGTEYYFVNKQHKTFYDLGKGGWYMLANELDAITDTEYLEELIYDDVFDFYRDQEQDPGNRKFCNELAIDLVKFVNGADTKNLFIVNDCGDDSTVFKGLGYRCVGDRYVNKNDDEPDLDNRHLKEPWARMYNLENMINKHIYAAVGNKYVPIQALTSGLIPLIIKYGGNVLQDVTGKFIVS